MFAKFLNESGVVGEQQSRNLLGLGGNRRLELSGWVLSIWGWVRIVNWEMLIPEFRNLLDYFYNFISNKTIKNDIY